MPSWKIWNVRESEPHPFFAARACIFWVHSPYVVLVVWSAACAAIFFWSNRASLRHARQVAYTTYPVPLPYMAFFTVLLYVACSAGFLVVYSALYFFVEWVT